MHLLFALFVLSSAQAAEPPAWGASPAAAIEQLGWDAATVERGPAGMTAYNRAGALTVARNADGSGFLLFDASGLLARVVRAGPDAEAELRASLGEPRRYAGDQKVSLVWGRGEVRLEEDGAGVWKVALGPEAAQSAVVPGGFSPRSLGLVDSDDDSTPLLGRQARLATAGGLVVAGTTHAGLGFGLVMGSRVATARAAGQLDPPLTLTAEDAEVFARDVAVADRVGMASVLVAVSVLTGTAIALLVEAANAEGAGANRSADARRERQRLLGGFTAAR